MVDLDFIQLFTGLLFHLMYYVNLNSLHTLYHNVPKPAMYPSVRSHPVNTLILAVLDPLTNSP